MTKPSSALDRDIHKQPEDDAYKLHEMQVLRTYLNGNFVHQADNMN